LVSINESILEKWCDSVDVVLRHLANVLKHEG
jgi:hypothetical protein